MGKVRMECFIEKSLVIVATLLVFGVLIEIGQANEIHQSPPTPPPYTTARPATPPTPRITTPKSTTISTAPPTPPPYTTARPDIPTTPRITTLKSTTPPYTGPTCNGEVVRCTMYMCDVCFYPEQSVPILNGNS